MKWLYDQLEKFLNEYDDETRVSEYAIWLGTIIFVAEFPLEDMPMWVNLLGAALLMTAFAATFKLPDSKYPSDNEDDEED